MVLWAGSEELVRVYQEDRKGNSCFIGVCEMICYEIPKIFKDIAFWDVETTLPSQQPAEVRVCVLHLATL